MPPMLATTTATLPNGDGWTYEFKWDGVRARLSAGPRLTSRLGNDVTGGYPELAAQFAGLGDIVLDGEIVAFDAGRPSFELLQTRMHLRGADAVGAAATTPVVFVVFDLLRVDGADVTAQPWSSRRARLEELAADHDGWTLSPAFDDAAAVEAVARARGLEGVVAKRLGSPYREGRSEDWRKLRFARSGEFVVVGWEAAAERPDALTSLLLATSGPGGLRYAGKVGSGIDGRVATRLGARLTGTSRPAVPDPPARSPGRVTRWVEPQVVVEVGFGERTTDGRLRHPVFRGIRADKTVSEATGDG